MTAIPSPSPVLALVVPHNDPAILLYRDQAKEIARVAGALVIDSEAAKAEAIELVSRIAKLLAGGEVKRHALVDGPGTYVRQTDALFREVLGPVKVANDAVRDKLRTYQREQERIAAEAAARAERARLAAEATLREAANAEAAAALARTAAATAQAAGQAAAAESAQAVAAGEATAARQLLDSAIVHEAAATVAQAEAVLPSRTMQTASGTGSMAKKWTFKLVNLDLVPTEYVLLNEAKVWQAIRAGVRDSPDGVPGISGLRIFQDVSLSVRTNK